MKKTKPTYTAPEIKNLLDSMVKDGSPLDEYPEVDMALQNFIDNNPDEETKKVMIELGSEYPEHVLEAYEEIASEAYSLESRARALRSIVKIFKCPVEDLPTRINDDNKTIATIAAWRLSLGR
jgi:hypothetical protein